MGVDEEVRVQNFRQHHSVLPNFNANSWLVIFRCPVLSEYQLVLKQSVTSVEQILSNLLTASQLKPNHYHSNHSRAFEFPAGNSNLLVKFLNSLFYVSCEADVFDSNLAKLKHWQPMESPSLATTL